MLKKGLNTQLKYEVKKSLNQTCSIVNSYIFVGANARWVTKYWEYHENWTPTT